jgi:hypothetical protein
MAPHANVFLLFSTVSVGFSIVITISKLYCSELELVVLYILSCIHSASIALDVWAYAQHLVLLCSFCFCDCGLYLPDRITSQLIKLAKCLPTLLSLLFKYCRLQWNPCFIYKEWRTDLEVCIG